MVPPEVVAVKVTGVPGVSAVFVKLVVNVNGLMVIVEDADAILPLKSVALTFTVKVPLTA